MSIGDPTGVLGHEDAFLEEGDRAEGGAGVDCGEAHGAAGPLSYYVLAGVVLLGALAAGCSSAGGGPASGDGGSLEGATSRGSDGAAVTDGGSGEAARGSDAESHHDGTGGGSDGAAGDAVGAVDAPDETAIPGWVLTWQDEFDGPDGSAVDPTKWKHDTGGGGWGNQEREYYTDGTQNAVQRGGNLVITATPDGASQYSCWYGTCLYTSARLLTSGLFSQTYGRFEARAKMPTGKGLWPAFWMLGENIDSVSWPACGEIDILETVGSDVTDNHGSLHGPGYNPTASYALPGGASYADDFHTFAAELEPGTVRFYVDDALFETHTSSDAVSSGGTWEFDGHPFFLLLNVAVGGAWPGDPDSATTFPQTLEVDWVRVYRKAGDD